MTSIIITLVIGIIIGFTIAWLIKKPQPQISEQEQEKQDRNKKIVEYIQSKGEASNNDIQELLGIGDSTATKYLQQMEDKGIIVQEGKEGRSVKYTLQ